MAAIDVRCEDVSKRYYVRRRRRPGSASLAESLRPPRSGPGVLGAPRRRLRGRPRRDARHRRTQRRRKEHTAQAARRDHRADARRHHARRQDLRDDRSRLGLPSGADRPRERLSQRRDPRHAPPRNRRAAGQHRGLLGRPRVPRHAGQALLVRHVRAGWGSRSPHTSRPTSFSSTKCWRWATPSSRHGACGGSRSSNSVGRR